MKQRKPPSGRGRTIPGALGLALVAVLVTGLWVGETVPRSSLLGPVVWHGPAHRRLVALTFDDGPDPRWTPGILRVLRTDHVPATFFVEGANAARYPALLRREKTQGDEIGNHSWDHPDLRWLSPNAIGREIDRTQRVIRHATGVTPRLFRPPYGDRSPFLWPEAHERGLQEVEWSLSPWRGRSPRPGDLVRRTLALSQPGDIILLHDGRGNRRCIVQALPTIIQDLRSRGYRFVTVSELEAPRNPARA